MEIQQSPAVQRITSVLNFFLEHPTQPFTLAQVAKSLRLSRATAHSILLSFVAIGYLHRRPDKSYILGLALPNLAASALRQISPLSFAGQEMRALADDLNVVATALFFEDDGMVIRERAASVNHLNVLANRTLGVSHPFSPSSHHVFQLPLTNAEYDTFLGAMYPAMSDTARGKFHAVRQFVRKHGFVVKISNEGDENADSIAQSFPSDIEPEENYDVFYLIGPIFNNKGDVEFTLALSGFDNPLTGKEVLEAGALLNETCQRISKFMGGGAPSPL